MTMSKTSTGVKIFFGYVILVTIAAIVFGILYFRKNDGGDEKTITYDPMTNPAVQELIKQYVADTSRANERIRADSVHIKGLIEYSLNALKSVSNSEAKIINYYNQIKSFNKMVEAIKNEEDLQGLINRMYKEIHKNGQ